VGIDVTYDCLSCEHEQAGAFTPEQIEMNRCPKSKKPCGHHCNCSWIHDHCHWCGKDFGCEHCEKR
jgi:hypothetical protein